MTIPEVAFEWIMAHPWMSFFVVLGVISAAQNIITAFLKIFTKKDDNVNVTIVNSDKDNQNKE